MGFDVQIGIVLLIVAACAVYVGLYVRRTWSKKSNGCPGHCGCDAIHEERESSHPATE